MRSSSLKFGVDDHLFQNQNNNEPCHAITLLNVHVDANRED